MSWPKNRLSFRTYRTLTIRLCILIWVIGLWYWVKVYHILESIESSIDNEAFELMLSNEYPKNEGLQSIDIRSEAYNDMFETETLINILKNYNYQERCDLYFKHLFINDPNWLTDPNLKFKHNRNDFKTYKEYEKDKVKEWKEKNPDKEVDDMVKQGIKESYYKVWENIKHDEQVMHDYLTHLKVFNKCFITFDNFHEKADNAAFIREQKSIVDKVTLDSEDVKSQVSINKIESCNEIESKLYPWLDFKLPKYERWDGKFHKFPKFKHPNPKLRKRKSLSLFNNGKTCFLNDFKNQLNGKGIVLTISDSHLDLTIRLIRLLRALYNELPIQIVFISGLSKESKDRLVTESRSEFHSFPKQDLWFVNASDTIRSDYHGKFAGFANKIVATLFNSFEEMILLDADTVILEDPEFFFNLPKYLKTGTMFYKDRSAVEYRPSHDITFFKKLMPSNLDTMLFNIPQVTDYSLNRGFFKGMNHYMESGLVILNRLKHFGQPLIMSQLNFHLPVQSRVYGDKELFWLSLVLSGDEEYSFNDHFSASIGFITPDSERHSDVKFEKKFKSKEICSNHPGHIHDEDNHTLLWFNSGFRHCGQLDKVNFENEFKSKRRYKNIKTIEEFKTFFNNKLVLKHAIIPPHKTMRAENIDGEAESAWINMSDYCSGYTWCGYSEIGGNFFKSNGEKSSNVEKGLLIDFSKEEIDKFDKLGDIWMSDFDFQSQKGKKVGKEQQ